jgi:hypothetical protein
VDISELLFEILKELKEIKELLAPHACSTSEDTQTYKFIPYKRI